MIAGINAQVQFLSSNAQDFIEDSNTRTPVRLEPRFLSSNAQDFIEEGGTASIMMPAAIFLSSNAQDFIEERTIRHSTCGTDNS